jgi:hypothetical protein
MFSEVYVQKQTCHTMRHVYIVHTVLGEEKYLLVLPHGPAEAV